MPDILKRRQIELVLRLVVEFEKTHEMRRDEVCLRDLVVLNEPQAFDGIELLSEDNCAAGGRRQDSGGIRPGVVQGRVHERLRIRTDAEQTAQTLNARDEVLQRLARPQRGRTN